MDLPFGSAPSERKMGKVSGFKRSCKNAHAVTSRPDDVAA